MKLGLQNPSVVIFCFRLFWISLFCLTGNCSAYEISDGGAGPNPPTVPAASAQITGVADPANNGIYHYTVTLHNTGALGGTSIKKFLFGGVPGQNYMASSPTNLTSQSNWTGTIIHGGDGDGYAIQWSMSPTTNVLDAASQQTFSFDSTLTPTQMAGNSSLYPAAPVGTSYVFDFDDASVPNPSFDFVVQSPSSAMVPSGTRTDLYLVYSGSVSQSTWEGGSTGTTAKSSSATVYVIFDLADSSSYSVLYVAKDQSYIISSRILSADGTTLAALDNGNTASDTNPAHNFLNGTTNQPKPNAVSPTKGYAAFRYSGGGSDSITVENVTHDYPQSTEVYATGALAGLSTTKAATIVAANAKAKVSGVYTINPLTPAITNGLDLGGYLTMNPYPSSLSGVLFSYGYNPTLVAVPDANFPAMTYLTISGKVTLKLDTTLTALANAGGSFKLKGQLSSTTIPAVTGMLTSTSSPTIYEVFLYKIAKSLGLPDGYVPAP